jgi:hypothetical protein
LVQAVAVDVDRVDGDSIVLDPIVLPTEYTPRIIKQFPNYPLDRTV